MTDRAPREQLDEFLAKYTPEMVTLANASLERLRPHVPGAVEMVYDNYNALVVGFCASERPSEAVLSLAFFPRWVTLCFLMGSSLADPHGLLQGAGNQVRHIVLEGPEHIDHPHVLDLVRQAVAASPTPFEVARPNRMVIRSVSAKQRPRRPAPGKSAADR